MSRCVSADGSEHHTVLGWNGIHFPLYSAAASKLSGDTPGR
ncbi:hypothetical protein ACFSGI_07800 [Paenibacillus nicotianae]|uniref:Uncharacterized protein n=1 Tax=Paenibacillus nicotianae TaxID=1526551 RepID=A0ABW4UU70_9BACL